MPPALTHESTTRPSKLQPHYDLATYTEVVREVGLSPITDRLPANAATGSPRIFREELAIIILPSRSEQTNIPRNLSNPRKPGKLIRYLGPMRNRSSPSSSVAKYPAGTPSSPRSKNWKSSRTSSGLCKRT